MTAKHRPTSAAAQTPPACKAKTPGAELVRLPVRRDGKPYDALEALAAMPATHWAWPFAPLLRYLGCARDVHLFELRAEDRAAVEAGT